MQSRSPSYSIITKIHDLGSLRKPMDRIDSLNIPRHGARAHPPLRTFHIFDLGEARPPVNMHDRCISIVSSTKGSLHPLVEG